MNNRSAEVLIELEAILQANTDLEAIGIGKVIPIAQETNRSAGYITFTNSVPRLVKNSTEMDGYDFHGFFVITINADCTDDKYLIYDLVDSVQRSILSDQTVWAKLIDRDIISTEYDNAEFSPKRSAILALEVVYRLVCR
jgi:hypothetical protein